MATDQLTHIIEERKEQFSDEDLEAAHKRIEEILSTRKWDAIWKKPEAIALARKLAEESREDDQLFTTQEAADFLNISRPSVVQLLEAGEIPFMKVGTHRRIQFSDLLEYKNRIRQERRKALAEMLELGQLPNAIRYATHALQRLQHDV